ncbi:MAG TPA: class I SAM-dependent methyltransferase, partial [Thermoanaerobaculia bacterium]|nr:class I SAM-dependent methyltransferase [Thermoanaerobaculia bacterium]
MSCTVMVSMAFVKRDPLSCAVVTRDEVTRYLAETRSVEGWFFPVDAYLFGFIDDVQQREGIAGNLFEIGVHHGKTALFLARCRRDGEALGVCDVFEQQELNRDRSGEGSREVFLRNMGDHPVRVLAKESARLTAEDTTTTCRFVHIDGGHRAEDVVNDLSAAERALLPDGVVAVDDAFNPNWPGVSEGLYQFMNAHDAFAPLLIGGNKVLLARPAAIARYERHFDAIAAAVAAPFTFDRKEWLGRPVFTAIRHAWVDLDPLGTAKQHM